MKPFHFTLEVLRTLRRRQEQLASEAYAQATRHRQQASLRLEQARQHCQSAWNESQSRLAQGMSAAEFAQAQSYAQRLELRCQEAAQALLQADQAERQKREAMTAARREVEVVETCFEKQRLRYQQACQREEQKFIDELAGRRQARPNPYVGAIESACN